MTTTLRVQSARRPYDVTIGPGLLDETGPMLLARGVDPTVKLFLVTDDEVARFGYAERVMDSCRQAGFAVAAAVVPAGDASKSFANAERLYQEMLRAGIRRSGVLLAVGGGMVGDLGGFVAATYQRGIRYVQVPTTLLAHDSSIGGKVAVNLPEAKNLVGAFHPPIAVIFDVTALSSLPAREWCGGMAEVIKHGLIGDPQLFADLEAAPVTSYPGPERAEALIARAAAVKVRIVEEDEHEAWRRMVLNVGHTVGHAVEQVSGYQIHHGEAVAIGLRVESEIAWGRGWLSADDKDRLIRVLAAHGLPVTVPQLPWDEVVAVLHHDKKHGDDHWTFALPRAVGDVVIVRDVRYEELAAAWSRSAADADTGGGKPGGGGAP
ncbi:3-dehydroquinate synthase [Alicyclobacillus cellulosilyticus]|uniref:3-dehydroquinate synthase n=1 Tax=Alicyclobacillus cellulosilyticus TaxID=1003997 RepID=A0A917NKG8_9BACL|nr:3-dehydroquinate synthase [Alicyclobacillus cellulosilyticus]GGJ07539.1 3-dehydroquinate synthase [Alicyclobacillus cellulosilyticus]